MRPGRSHGVGVCRRWRWLCWLSVFLRGREPSLLTRRQFVGAPVAEYRFLYFQVFLGIVLVASGISALFASENPVAES